MLSPPLHCKALESAAVLKSSLQKDNQQRALASSSDREKATWKWHLQEGNLSFGRVGVTSLPDVFLLSWLPRAARGAASWVFFNIWADRTTLILPKEQEAFESTLPSCTRCTGIVQRRDTCQIAHQLWGPSSLSQVIVLIGIRIWHFPPNLDLFSTPSC